MAVPQIVVWKIMLAKPVVGLGKKKKTTLSLKCPLIRGVPRCVELPWERDPAIFGIGINFSEANCLAISSKGRNEGLSKETTMLHFTLNRMK
jgi:hypothetical protein